MINENGLMIDEETGEILERDIRINKKGLYAPLGIPAYNVLARAKEHGAKDVLTALLTFRHKDSNHVWPSQKSIMFQSGRGKETVIKGTALLEEFGFVKVKRISDGYRMHNHYFIQDSCYLSELMNEKARTYLQPVGSCPVCTKLLFPGTFKKSGDSMAHWGCSGNLGEMRAKSRPPMVKKSANEVKSDLY